MIKALLWKEKLRGGRRGGDEEGDEWREKRGG